MQSTSVFLAPLSTDSAAVVAAAEAEAGATCHLSLAVSIERPARADDATSREQSP